YEFRWLIPIYRATPARSGAWFTLLVDLHRRARPRGGLHLVLASAERVRDVPVLGLGTARHFAAALDIAVVRGLPVAIARDVHADGAARHRTADRREVLAAPSADLVTEDAADDGARDAAQDI